MYAKIIENAQRKTFFPIILHLKESEFRYNKKHDMLTALRTKLRETLI